MQSELRSDGKLKHAPPMRKSRMEMAKLQVRAALGWTGQEAYPTVRRNCTSSMGPTPNTNMAAPARLPKPF